MEFTPPDDSMVSKECALLVRFACACVLYFVCVGVREFGGVVFVLVCVCKNCLAETGVFLQIFTDMNFLADTRCIPQDQQSQKRHPVQGKRTTNSAL